MNNNELYHYGVLGMKWGVRRYHNSDGSLNESGRKHYGYAKADEPNAKAKRYRNQATKYKNAKSWKEYMDIDVDDNDAKQLKEFKDEYKRMYKRGDHLKVAKSLESQAKRYQDKADVIIAKADMKYAKHGKKYADQIISEMSKN